MSGHFDGLHDSDRGAVAVAAVTAVEVAHAFDQLREYHGKTNSWGKRSALISTVGMLRGRYQRVQCDSDGVACCVRCQTMSLVIAVERLLAASAIEAAAAGETTKIGSTEGESAVAKPDAQTQSESSQ